MVADAMFAESNISWHPFAIPILRLIISTNIRTPQFLDQDSNDADEQNKVYL